LGEEGADCPLDACVAISNPWNLDVSNAVLKSSWLGLNVYQRVMGTSMRSLWETHKKDILDGVEGIDVEKVESIKYLFEFDR
jgi:predicted alpha/beta-fold hydrolase